MLLKGPIKPEFRASGLALDHIQFAMFNVVGEGAPTKLKAVKQYFVTFYRLWRKK